MLDAILSLEHISNTWVFLLKHCDTSRVFSVFSCAIKKLKKHLTWLGSGEQLSLLIGDFVEAYSKGM